MYICPVRVTQCASPLVYMIRDEAHPSWVPCTAHLPQRALVTAPHVARLHSADSCAPTGPDSDMPH